MARIIFAALFVLLAVFILLVDAAPLKSRQIGDIQCNVARLQIVSDLAETGNLLSKINGNDAATTSAVSTAQSGLSSAGDGIKTIAAALIEGQTAPADARDQTADGLQTALTALSGLNSTDPAVASTLSKLNEAISAGQSVVSDCN
ncbi:MAG: hypothetical protein NXY57DRAFT_958873 [Lentinula lateritia]|uniref:Hydrophobic surface binding protein n=1 Tax=Lentinula lateritia TaxID=40482 RepID=A0ABQ8VEE8_9AGAR|nr:hypothetical protein EV359DRAFT_77954 [Lentinula novae-zelandiae]KAJ3934667.1 MAG: hypothetical protein NXY57DRAFT_958873 [Lentinula lateritia]KAJ4491662.1 hypothetical protein C8R41DRAFT_372400 [Lentinula lateritia]